jgi:pilus assembly protein Flp/PilA
MFNFLRDEHGASAAEYALMLAVISGGVAVASLGLSDSIAVALGRAQGKFALVGGGQAAASSASASSAAGGEAGAAPEEGLSAAGNNGKGNGYGRGKGDNGQGNAYGKTK